MFAYVHGGLASTWRAALFPSSWHLQLQLGGIYFISLVSFLTDSFDAFVTKTEECHINLLFHYDNCVFFLFFPRIQCHYIKPVVYPQACWRSGSLVALAAVIIEWSITLKRLSSWFFFNVNLAVRYAFYYYYYKKSSLWQLVSCYPLCRMDILNVFDIRNKSLRVESGLLCPPKI